MAPSFTPYTYIQCPCSDAAATSTVAARDAVSDPALKGDDRTTEAEEDDHAFDPRSPRANYSLYPLDYLLYCEDCHQIRCPRCVAEEIVTYYCPNCLFEVPTSNLKSEGNRCTRSCFQCPVCIAPLTATSAETPSSGSSSLSVPDGAAAAHGHHGGPYILSCTYCQWSSTEIGIQFDKPNGLYGQLAKLRNGGKPRLTPRDRKDRRRDLATGSLSSVAGLGLSSPLSGGAGEPDRDRDRDRGGHTAEQGLDLETQFANLKQFYQRQLSETSGASMSGLSSFGDLGFASPASLSRIMNMYTSGMGAGSRFDKKAQSRMRPMREARDESEGLVVAQLDETADIARLMTGSSAMAAAADGNDGAVGSSGGSSGGWDITASSEQRAAQPTFVGDGHLHGRTRFVDELRPIPFLLRTRRSKRCPVCRHLICKPDVKPAGTRYKIQLVAGKFIPRITIRPMSATAAASGTGGGSSSASRSLATAASAAAAAAAAGPSLLEPLKPVQFILTFKNPIYEKIRVTLATPSTTPGRFASKVTLLCPQFEIDSETDVWDDALRDGNGSGSGSGGGRGSGSVSSSRRPEDGGQQGQAMAGKIWDRGRNWVSTVLEVVPPSLDLSLLATTSRSLLSGGGEAAAAKVDLSPVREDEDIVEIPMFVRVEWEADPAQDGVGAGTSKDKDAKEKRELAYWCVLGVGRVRQ